MRTSLGIIDTTWSPVLANASDKDLAEALSREEFVLAHKRMLEEFDRVEPVVLDDMGNTYIPFSEKLRLIEEHFDFQTFVFSPQFLSIGGSESPVCYMTLLVLTENGYRPWFSRMGMGASDMPGPDGLLADAETSAKRRILIALGMGKPGEEETSSDRSVGTSIIEKYMSDQSANVADLVSVYNSKMHAMGLEPLHVKMSTLKAIKENSGTEAGLTSLGDEDIKKISTFISKSQNKQ